MSSNVIQLQRMREIKQYESEDHAYKARILVMDKLELLEEMIQFQEERKKMGKLSLSMMTRGKILFHALEKSAETDELKLLTRSYRRHLEYEMTEYLKNPEGYRPDDMDWDDEIQ